MSPPGLITLAWLTPTGPPELRPEDASSRGLPCYTNLASQNLTFSIAVGGHRCVVIPHHDTSYTVSMLRAKPQSSWTPSARLGVDSLLVSFQWNGQLWPIRTLDKSKSSLPSLSSLAGAPPPGRAGTLKAQMMGQGPSTTYSQQVGDEPATQTLSPRSGPCRHTP